MMGVSKNRFTSNVVVLLSFVLVRATDFVTIGVVVVVVVVGYDVANGWVRLVSQRQ